MSGRYHLNSTPADVARHFDVDVQDNFPPRYNIAPTQPIATIRMSEQREREYALMRWGFVPSWAKGEYLQRLGPKPLINARSETAAEKPTFRHAFKRRRCLIPADGFYEWKGEAGDRQPYNLIRGGLFGFAGLWETAIDAEGGEIDTCAVLTVAAGPDVRVLNSREPIVIAPEHYELWLTADERDLDYLYDLLRPSPKGTWRHYPVSKAVGSPSNDGPDLLKEVAL